MGRYGDNAPVSHTCPMIDGVISAINDLYKSSEEMSRGELDYLEKTLEKIRSHNDALRTWGNELYAKSDEQEKEIDELRDIINDLEKEVESKNDEIKDLEKDINELNKQYTN